MITVKNTNEILTEKYEHFDNKGNSLGFLNYIENMEIHSQCIETKTEGYYYVVDGEKISIHPKNVNIYPKDIYSQLTNLLCRIF